MTTKFFRIAKAITIAFYLSFSTVTTAASVSESSASSNLENNANCAWLRNIKPPRLEIPIIITQGGGSFVVRSATLGYLRTPAVPDFYLPTDCSVTVRVQPDLTGYNLIYTVNNPTNQTLDLPTVQVPGNVLAPRIEHLDHRFGSEWEVIDASDGEQFSSRKAPYPESLYAPVTVLRDHRVAVGFALHYDVLNYRHQIRTHVYRGGPGTPYANRWTARFYLEGTIAPGETRKYKLSVYYNQPHEWIHTLRPYKQFLRQTYGPVLYQQDMRPIWQHQLGDSLRLSPDNPRGFNPARADLNGFEQDVSNDIRIAQTGGFTRLLIRTCAGVYFVNRQNNFPPQITSEWTAPMDASAHEWKRVGQAGIDLILWWGRSGQYAERWDDDELDLFDPDNPEQSTRMLAEWTKAHALGAKGLGLDKFTQMPPWKAGPWLSKLWSVDPDAYFVAEPAAYDILNIWVPTSLYSSDVREYPHILADFLVPGREIWVFLENEDNNLERALELVEQGYTIVTNSQEFGANDLEQAIRRAQRCN